MSVTPAPLPAPAPAALLAALLSGAFAPVGHDTRLEGVSHDDVVAGRVWISTGPVTVAPYNDALLIVTIDDDGAFSVQAYDSGTDDSAAFGWAAPEDTSW